MGAIFSSHSRKHSKPSTSGKEEGSAVIALHTKESWDAHWHAHKDSEKLMVIDFSASWCGPCRFIEPVYKALAAKYTDVVFVKIDVDELSVVNSVHQEVSAQWSVEAMPTFVLVKGGKEVDRVVGADKDALEGKILQFRS